MKPTSNLILPSMMVGIYLFILSIVQIPSTFSNAESSISLEIAIQTALRENPELSAIREKVKVAQAQIDGIALLSNPELETEFVGGIDGEQQLELTQSFQLGGQRSHRKQIAKIQLEKVNAELAAASRLLTKSVKLAFYELVLVQEKLKLAKEIIQHNEQMHNIAHVQFETGDISVTQVNLANIQLQAALREAATLESELQLAQLEINSLMGTLLEATPIAVGGLSDKTFSPSLAEESDGKLGLESQGNARRIWANYAAKSPQKFVLEKKMKLDSLTAHALAHRAALKSMRLNAQLTEIEHRLAKAANIPDLSVAGLAQRRPDENVFGVKFSIPLPLFDRNRAEIDAAKAQQQVDAVKMSNQERQIAREVMAAFISLRTAQKALQFYEGPLSKNVLTLLNENLELTRTAYELGEAELLEVILMQNEFTKTRFAYLNALAASHKALAELEFAIGTSVQLLP